MALPRGTTGSLRPTFVSARLVSLAVRRAYAIALDERFPTALSPPSRASVTLSEATAPVKLPTCHGPGRGKFPPPSSVRASHDAGWYFTGPSSQASAWPSAGPTYATQRCATSNDKL